MKKIFCVFLIYQFCLADSNDDKSKINKNVAAFSLESIGKKIGEGESIDFCYEALKKSKAKFDFADESVLGKVIDSKQTSIEPGDMIYFEEAAFEAAPGKPGWNLDKQCGVVLSITSESDRVVSMASQNVRSAGLVSQDTLELGSLKKGKFILYRPVAAAETVIDAKETSSEMEGESKK